MTVENIDEIVMGLNGNFYAACLVHETLTIFVVLADLAGTLKLQMEHAREALAQVESPKRRRIDEKFDDYNAEEDADGHLSGSDQSEQDKGDAMEPHRAGSFQVLH